MAHRPWGRLETVNPATSPSITIAVPKLKIGSSEKKCKQVIDHPAISKIHLVIKFVNNEVRLIARGDKLIRVNKEYLSRFEEVIETPQQKVQIIVNDLIILFPDRQVEHQEFSPQTLGFIFYFIYDIPDILDDPDTKSKKSKKKISQQQQLTTTQQSNQEDTSTQVQQQGQTEAPQTQATETQQEQGQDNQRIVDEFLPICHLCNQVYFQPTTLTCSHTFCGGCLSIHWLMGNNVKCPECQEDVQYAFPNILFEKIVDNFLSRNFYQRRSDEDTNFLKDKNTINKALSRNKLLNLFTEEGGTTSQTIEEEEQTLEEEEQTQTQEGQTQKEEGQTLQEGQKTQKGETQQEESQISQILGSTQPSTAIHESDDDKLKDFPEEKVAIIKQILEKIEKEREYQKQQQENKSKSQVSQIKSSSSCSWLQSNYRPRFELNTQLRFLKEAYLDNFHDQYPDSESEISSDSDEMYDFEGGPLDYLIFREERMRGLRTLPRKERKENIIQLRMDRKQQRQIRELRVLSLLRRIDLTNQWTITDLSSNIYRQMIGGYRKFQMNPDSGAFFDDCSSGSDSSDTEDNQSSQQQPTNEEPKDSCYDCQRRLPRHPLKDTKCKMCEKSFCKRWNPECKPINGPRVGLFRLEQLPIPSYFQLKHFLGNEEEQIYFMRYSPEKIPMNLFKVMKSDLIEQLQLKLACDYEKMQQGELIVLSDNFCGLCVEKVWHLLIMHFYIYQKLYFPSPQKIDCKDGFKCQNKEKLHNQNLCHLSIPQK